MTDQSLAELEDYERRVLGHLPAYRTAQEFDLLDAEKQADYVAHFEANKTDPDDEPGAVAPLVRSYTLDELVARLKPDPSTDEDPQSVSDALSDLEARGLCVQSGGAWSMSAAGLAALTGSGD